jgi:probable F420-dependent oxidoreductase
MSTPAVDAASVVEDLSITLLAGRVPSSAPGLQQAVDAERLGFKRVWLPERYSNKDAGVLLGAMAARTSRIGVASGPLSIAARPPIVTAAMGATLHSVFGPRFTLGVGRGGPPQWYQGHGFSQVNYRTLVDLVGIIRDLWEGRTVHYDGPAGTYDGLSLVDLPDGPRPQIVFFHLGAEGASKVAANPVFDAVALANMTSPDVVARSIAWTRKEAERIGRDPDSLFFIAPVTTAPDLDETQTLLEVAVRVIVYLQLPVLGQTMAELNGWTGPAADRIRELPIFQRTSAGTLDQSVSRAELIEAARLVPEEWCRAAAAIGTAAECVRQVQRYRDAGAHEIDLYGSTPEQNAGFIQAWRTRPEASSCVTSTPVS